MMTAQDIAVEETVEALTPYLPEAPSRLLEIGSGEGRLASALISKGHDLVAVDEDRSAIEAAQQRGVDARVACWPQTPKTTGDEENTTAIHGPFDGILFTRSLHHIGELESALEAAWEALTPGGILIVQDWAWETVTEGDAELLHRLIDLARSAGWSVSDEWNDADGPPLRDWRNHLNEHGLHEWTTSRTALGARFQQRAETNHPYWFRYFVTFVEGVDRGGEIVKAVLELERSLIRSGALGALGRLWVGTRGPGT